MVDLEEELVGEAVVEQKSVELEESEEHLPLTYDPLEEMGHHCHLPLRHSAVPRCHFFKVVMTGHFKKHPTRSENP